MGLAGEYRFFDLTHSPADMRKEVIAGLTHEPKFIAPKYFYDERGSALFEAITRLPEYYLTRTEMGLFEDCLPEVRRLVGEGGCLVEYGSGSSRKIRRLLEVLRPAAYLPLDISKRHLERTARKLHEDYPQLCVYPVCVDITEAFALPEVVAGQRKLGFFPGSSIGNMEPKDVPSFLRQAARALGAGGRFLIGVDRKKNLEVLEAAYNDSASLTAAFNLNILNHLNARLPADFDLSAFRHLATYNQEAGCVQMHLQSLVDQSPRIDGHAIQLRKGEAIHTENSYKYDYAEFADLAERGGFRVEASWSDDDAYFTIFLLQAP